MDTTACRRIAACPITRPGSTPRASTWRLHVQGSVDAVLRRDENLVVHECATGTRVTCLAGSLWVTVSGDRRDHVMGIHESLTLGARSAAVIVHAFTESRVAIVGPADEPLTAIPAWQRTLARARHILLQPLQRGTKETP